MSSVRAERGYTTSVVILGGKDTYANEVMFKQRSYTDYILFSLPVWPDGLAINDVPLITSADLGNKLNTLRGKVSTLSVDFLDVLNFYSAITKQFMYWLLVICRLLCCIKNSNLTTRVYGGLQSHLSVCMSVCMSVCL